MYGLNIDVRFALRRLCASPGFTLFAIASLAVGIGVTTAVYSAVRSLLWMPLGVAHQDELVQVVDGAILYASMSWTDFVTLRRDQTSFHSVAALTRVHTSVTGAGEPRMVDGEAVSGEFFDTLQVQPRLGRLLDLADERSGAHVVVLSQAFWRNACASDPAIVGRTLTLGGGAFEIIGVVSGDFHGLEQAVLQDSIWIPLSALSEHAGALRAAPWQTLKAERAPTLTVWGRLKPGVSAARGTAEVSLLGRRLEAAHPTAPISGTRPRQWQLRAVGASLPYRSFTDTIMAAVLTSVATLLLVACTNLANLALARGTARAEEIAIRNALGADRWRLVREQLVESGIVVVSGGAFGLAILARLLDYWTGNLPIFFGVTVPFAPQLDASVLTASVVTMLIATIVFGVWPALQSTRSNVRAALGAGHGATPPKWRLHRTMIAWQVCGSVALLLVALLCAKILTSIDPGTGRHDDLALAQVDFTANGKNEPQMRQLVASILDDARVQRGIHAVSASTGLPFGGMIGGDSLLVTTPDHASEPEGRGIWSPTFVFAVTPQFFSTVAIRLVRGRAFTEADDAGAAPVAIVTEEFARKTFRSTDVVGRVLATRTTRAVSSPGRSGAGLGSLTIVGVSADDEPWATGQRPPLIFLPFAQRYAPFVPVTFTALASDAGAGVAALRLSIRRVDPDLSITSAGTSAVLLYGFYPLRVIALLAAALGALALVLAMAGLFGVLSHVVTKRTREIGIRLAIGAERRDIIRLVIGDGLQPVVKGLLLGLGIGVGARIAVKAFVVTTVAAIDPWPLLLLPIPFVLAALAACYVPAARAARVDPKVALRDL